MSELPVGWKTVSLDTVVRLLNGRAYNQAELLTQGKYRVLRVGNFFSNPNWYFSDLELDPTKYCDDGDLLYAWSASFGPKIWAGGKVIFHYHIWKVEPNQDAVLKKFLYHWFEWDKDNIKAEHGTGSTMIHVTKGDMEKRPLSLPPIPEQRRIVAKIDSLTAKSAHARDNLDHIPRLVEKYKQAVLAAAFRDLSVGRVAASEVSVADVAATVFDGPFGSNLKTADYTARGARVVRLENLGHLRFDAAKETYISDEKYETLKRHTLFEDDILFSSFIDKEIRVCRFPRDISVTAINKADCFCIRVDRRACLPRFLELRLACRSTYDALEQTVHGATRPRISLSQLREFRFNLPTLDEQEKIVRRIESAFAWIDRLAKEASSARKLVDHLDQAVLAKAFRGELVPQDPNDEPADVLLERIRAERAQAAAPQSSRRGRKSKPAETPS